MYEVSESEWRGSRVLESSMEELVLGLGSREEDRHPPSPGVLYLNINVSSAIAGCMLPASINS